MLDRSSLAEQIAASIIADILDRRVLPGCQLPSEPAMAIQFGVSRPVIREATRILTTQGVVRAEHGRGVTVQEPNDRSLVELITLCAWRRQVPARELWQARLFLEVPLAGMAAEMRDEADLACMRSALDRMREGMESNNIDDVDANAEFHRSVASAAHNEFLAMLMEPVTQVFRAVVRAFTARGLSRPGDQDSRESHLWPERSLLAHESIYEAIATRDASTARERMKAHFDDSLVRWEAVLSLTVDELLQNWPPHLNVLEAGEGSHSPGGRLLRRRRSTA